MPAPMCHTSASSRTATTSTSRRYDFIIWSNGVSFSPVARYSRSHTFDDGEANPPASNRWIIYLYVLSRVLMINYRRHVTRHRLLPWQRREQLLDTGAAMSSIETSS